MNEHDDDLASEVVEGDEIEQDVFNADEEPIASSGDKELEDADAPGVDDAEL